MIKAILFDLDNTLLDLADVHFDALNAALYKCNYPIIKYDEHLSLYNGLPTKIKLGMMINKELIKKKDFDKICHLKQEATIDAIQKNISTDKEKIEIMRWLEKQKIKVSCVSNSVRNTINEALERSGLLEYMDHIISNEDIDYPKPNPAGFLQSMALLGASPDETIIVEDSKYGIEAAKAAKVTHVIRVKDPSELTLELIKETIDELTRPMCR